MITIGDYSNFIVYLSCMNSDLLSLHCVLCKGVCRYIIAYLFACNLLILYKSYISCA